MVINSPGLYTTLLSKSPAKAQRRKENRKNQINHSFRLPLRLCAFAGKIFFAILCLLVIPVRASPQSRITISIITPGEIAVRADLYSPSRSWSFRNAYAGVLGIAERVDDFGAITGSGQDVRAKKIATGEFRSDLEATRITYKVRLSEINAASVSHVSWLTSDYGVLMLADLIPQDFTNLSIDFELPKDWQIETSNTQVDEKAVFLVGHSLRKTSTSIEQMPLDLVVSGAWKFKDANALKAAGKVLKKYLELTGYRLPGRSTILIAPLPVQVGTTKWRAETRGSTVLLLIDPGASFKNWVGQLGVIFTHELLHLWVPNSLRLDGDYDWFFEGFTLYIALRTALELKIINFKEFLDTLARVYDSYLSNPDDLSLIDASERRWTTSGSFVYDKGMLAAFLYDLLLRTQSAGKITLADKYRELFAGHATDHGNANEAIIALLGSSPAAKDFTKSYIDKSTRLELERLLPLYGLTLDSSGSSSQLRVSRALSSDQKRLLRSLGLRD